MTDNQTHTIFNNYPGSKKADGVYQRIINFIPKHVIYFELFLGSGSIYNIKKAARFNILADLCSEVTSYFEPKPNTFTKIINIDALQFLQSLIPLSLIFQMLEIPLFIYLDPPYPLSSRKNSNTYYNHEMTDQQHRDLLSIIIQIPAAILISTYPNSIYSKRLLNWNYKSYITQTRSGPVTECLYFNYPQPTELHEYTFIGSDFRERDRLKGIKIRNINKLNNMEPTLLNSILDSLSLIPSNKF